MIQPTLFNLHPNEYSQGLRYSPSAVNLDRCMESCNNLNDLSNRLCVPNKTEDLNLNVFNIMTGINESKRLTKHISCECKCRFDGRKCNSNQKWNNNKCRCEFKIPAEYHACKKDFIWNHATCNCENGEYVGSIIDDSLVMCDETIKGQKVLQKIASRQIVLQQKLFQQKVLQ